MQSGEQHAAAIEGVLFKRDEALAAHEALRGREQELQRQVRPRPCSCADRPAVAMLAKVHPVVPFCRQQSLGSNHVEVCQPPVPV